MRYEKVLLVTKNIKEAESKLNEVYDAYLKTFKKKPDFELVWSFTSKYAPSVRGKTILETEISVLAFSKTGNFSELEKITQTTNKNNK